MEEITDISVFDLVMGLLSLIIPIFFLVLYKVRLIKDTLVAVFRMIIQLSLVAAYLEVIFKLNNPWINLLWILIMLFVSAITSIQRLKLKFKYFLLPLFSSALLALLLVDVFFLGIVMKLDNLFDARYLIPITGMILGNSLNNNIIGMSTYFYGLKEKSDLYYFLYTNSGSKKIAIRPFISNAIYKGLNPLIATTSVIGLISLPGMMTGQILGGSSPLVAIKYQIMVMIAILIACSLTLVFSIIFSNRFVFDEYGRFRKDVFK